MRKYKLISLISAILIYIIIVIVIVISIMTHSSDKKIDSKIYTTKVSNSIEVSIGSSIPKSVKNNNSKNAKKPKDKKKSVNKKVNTENKVPKKIRNNKSNDKPKKITKKSPKKIKTKEKQPKTNEKEKSHKVTKKATVKKINSSKLFGSIKDLPSNSNVNNKKPTGSNGKSLIKNDGHKGILDRYRGKIHDLLFAMPLQNNFAGEKVLVELNIRPDGMFEYKVIKGSLNPEFLLSFKKYLNQLKKFGFGPTPGGKSLNFNLEFVAKK